MTCLDTLDPVSILIVDDHPENLMVLEAILKKSEVSVVRAASGDEALRKLLYEDFAVILLDVQMPGMDGFETAAMIRGREKSRHTPIIFLTAIDKNERRVVAGYEIGAVDYLFKPIMPEILRSKVNVFVDLFRTQAEIKAQAKQMTMINQDLAEEIAQRRRAEQEIKVLNSHLEQRAIELEVANQELQAFSYAVSHDLRTHLSHLSFFSQFLLDNQVEKLDPTGQDYLSEIRDAAERMEELTTDLLRLSRLNHQEIQRVSVDLSGLAIEISFKLQQTQPQRQAEFNTQAGITALCDRQLLQIVLENLLGNAWKYTSHRELAHIEFGQVAGASDSNGREPIYFVRDNGIGFDMKEGSEKLFKPFQRLHSSADFPGTGIGLTTVQRIIQRHGGRIWAESMPGQGSQFSFTLGQEPDTSAEVSY